MQLDVRLPMGALFCILGGLVLFYGLLKSLLIDIRWGAAMLVFGLVCLFLCWSAAKKAKDAPVEPELLKGSGKES